MTISNSFQTYQASPIQNKPETPPEDISKVEGNEQNRKNLMEHLSDIFPPTAIKAIEESTKDMTFIDALIFTDQLLMTLSDYSAGKAINSPYMVGDGFDGKPIHTDKLITKNEAKNINFDDFLTKALKSFEDGMNSSKGEVQDSYVSLYNNFFDLKQSYDLQKSEPIYA